FRRASNVIENDVVPKPGTRLMFRVVEAVDHRQPVPLPVGQAGADQTTLPPVRRRFPIFDDKAGNGSVFHHVRVIYLVHGGHATPGMPTSEIELEQFELLTRRPGPTFGDDQVVVPPQVASLAARRLELFGHDPHRYAGLAIDAARPVRHGLAAAETDPPERVVERLRMGPLELGESLALRLARQIRTRRRAGDEKSRKSNRCGHVAGGPLT